MVPSVVRVGVELVRSLFAEILIMTYYKDFISSVGTIIMFAPTFSFHLRRHLRFTALLSPSLSIVIRSEQSEACHVVKAQLRHILLRVSGTRSVLVFCAGRFVRLDVLRTTGQEEIVHPFLPSPPTRYIKPPPLRTLRAPCPFFRNIPLRACRTCT